MTESYIENPSENTVQNLENIATFVRKTALETIIQAGSGHIGGNLSSVELVTALYFGGQFNFDPVNPKNENRDRVLIRGHEGPLRYTIFSLLGYINPEELKTYRSLGSRLQGHEEMGMTPGVDITPSGSLGMLLSYGVGSAIANKDKGLDSTTIVFLGDGEEQEGNVSEAARHATSLGLDNLICIVDSNKKQLSRETGYSDGSTDLAKVWEGYGWKVREIKDGHDIREILDVYSEIKQADSPTLVIGNTVKGYGVEASEQHFSGYHTLSAVPDKSIAANSLAKLEHDVCSRNLTHSYISSLALSEVSTPSANNLERISQIDKNVYDIRTATSGISLEEAQDNYMSALKVRMLGRVSFGDFYFVTPDLLRKDTLEEAGIQDFAHFIDTGIREQHAIAMCHGISIENPNARIYVCYGDAFVYRALDQINAAATGGSNLMIVGENAGLFQGQNGKTHQSVGQSNALMGIPELKFFEPADAVDLHNVFSEIMVKNEGVSFVRFHRGNVDIERNTCDKNNTNAYPIHMPDGEPELVIVSSGFTAENSVLAAKSLESEYNIRTMVINVVNQKDLSGYLPGLLRNTAPIVTVYNGSPTTLASSVALAVMSDTSTPRPRFISGHGFESGTTGKVEDIIKFFGLDAEGIKEFCIKSMRNFHND